MNQKNGGRLTPDENIKKKRKCQVPESIQERRKAAANLFDRMPKTGIVSSFLVIRSLSLLVRSTVLGILPIWTRKGWGWKVLFIWGGVFVTPKKNLSTFLSASWRYDKYDF